MTFANTLEVEVTQEDVNNGRRGNCVECPFALALNREINHPVAVGRIITDILISGTQKAIVQ